MGLLHVFSSHSAALANPFFQSSILEPNTHITTNDVDKRWKYRVGWLRLCHERVITSPSSGNVSERDLQDPASRTSITLDKHHIAYRGSYGSNFLTLAYRTQRRYLSSPPEDHFRVLVNGVFDPEQQKAHANTWAEAVVDIHHAIRGIPSLRGIGIELHDRMYEVSLHLDDFPPHSEQTLEAWMTQYRPQIFNKFESLPRLWQAMALLGLKALNEHTEDHKCVSWFDAIETENALWRDLEAELVPMLPDNVSVEIWQARNKLLYDDDLPTVDTVKDLQIEDFVSPPPKSGTSLYHSTPW
ncbi:hypothetical protein UA08_04400 [Talaromyces atroroseus]|uniref:Uncharacterized protein n=1 Tax=Talaromyces atroroseus TaxID=1441469 RepID=A0A1Q5Q8M0_TALAT|nr:hypothetical protein UA08_04400 [Talaromyces atroroseus]OKL60454.1 hypothetical protein UA08_04400 [Talaromyces atroroseus]